MTKFEIIQQRPTPEEIARVDEIFDLAAKEFVAPSQIPKEDFGLQIRSDENKIIAGLTAKLFWNWMYIDMLWVEPEFQKSGIGTRLIYRAEEIARERKFTGIYLWTQSWQAPDFYRKLGYTEIMKVEDFPPGHARFAFRKYL